MDEMIITERLVLRRFRDSDLEPLAEMSANPNVMEYFPGVLSELQTREMMHRIDLHFQKNGFGLFAVEMKDDGSFAGLAGLYVPNFESFFTPCVEIGWRFGSAYWGRGLATEAANAVLDYGFRQLGIPKIFSFTSVLNKRSEKLMQRIGMKYIDDFDHPQIDKNSRLCRHVLYRKDLE